MAEDTRDGYGKQFHPINVWSLELKALYFVVIFPGYLLQPLHCTAFVFPRVLHGGDRKSKTTGFNRALQGHA